MSCISQSAPGLNLQFNDNLISGASTRVIFPLLLKVLLKCHAGYMWGVQKEVPCMTESYFLRRCGRRGSGPSTALEAQGPGAHTWPKVG